ncbi:ABC transporter ATP-binding protein [Planomicrobium sp. CPCC 101110]|uniref:ABC transporter ATP-binding protein n=1 Tax=Planomicrobium sp. CPCC 101110 TaxID=2599619 RepID=UPI0011B4B1C2|nr:ABC transporter ATP-binding protein [Planomicrobium sp. CPCC 101110]TWT25450.1 ABC transporter ATP-binding protein [Planomicrobium sp. CPCC 101110]
MIELVGVSKKYGSFTALHEVDLEIEQGEFIAILGPSGCGKTTLLKLLAGFMGPTDGFIVMDDSTVASAKRVTPPEKRNIGMVFQSFALWPHMTIADHIKFPLDHHPNRKKESRQEVQERMGEVLRLVGLDSFSDRYPSELSGGQKQRVALARAIAPKPNLMLMDEPFSALDVELRMEMRKEIQKLHRETGASIVFVTHDQGEALAIADRIVVMNQGRIEQIASPEMIYTRPETEFVATFVGKCNLVKGQWQDGSFIPKINPHCLWPDLGVAKTFKKNGIYPVRPEQLQLSMVALNGVHGRVTFVQYQGHEIHYTVEISGETWTVHESVYSPRFYVGDEVTVGLKKAVKPEKVLVSN